MLIKEMLPKRPDVFLPIKFFQYELVRIRNSAEIAALYEGSTISRPPCTFISLEFHQKVEIVSNFPFFTGSHKEGILVNSFDSF